jgi:hypothetical protein
VLLVLLVLTATTRYLSAASFPFDIAEGPPPSPTPSSDITLNALVQHGAHKMDCDRAFLSLIDNRSQFICAEMTRNQSLFSPDLNEPLLLGTSRIALEWGVCPYTMSIFHGKPVCLPDSPVYCCRQILLLYQGLPSDLHLRSTTFRDQLP